jgi:hypothetical protein
MSFVNIYPKNVLVKGFNRCGIVNLNQGVFHALPSEIYNLLNNNLNTNSFEDILSNFNKKEVNLVRDFINHLCDNNILFLSEEKINFRKDKFESFSPFIITNIIIESDKGITNFKSILNQIEIFNCKNVEIRFYESIDFTLIFEITSYIESINSTINSLTFIINNFNKKISQNKIIELINKIGRAHV